MYCECVVCSIRYLFGLGKVVVTSIRLSIHQSTCMALLSTTNYSCVNIYFIFRKSFFFRPPPAGAMYSFQYTMCAIARRICQALVVAVSFYFWAQWKRKSNCQYIDMKESPCVHSMQCNTRAILHALRASLSYWAIQIDRNWTYD